MPATGQCGFDLYVGPPFAQRYCSTAVYDHRQTSYSAQLFDHHDGVLRNFTLNFPLYQGVKELSIGLDPEAQVLPPPPYAVEGRIVIYGTSITQGGCASRPGMAYTNVLSRALNIEIVNLGFSGSGKGEPEVARVVAEVSRPLLFVLDYEGNQDYEGLKATLPKFIRILRESHATVPILVLSRIAFARDLTHEESRQTRALCRDMQAQTVEALRRNGGRHIYFLDGSALLGTDFDECTVDGVHPNDFGFMRMANALAPVVRRILGIPPGDSPPEA
jgi:hypothetical protein